METITQKQLRDIELAKSKISDTVLIRQGNDVEIKLEKESIDDFIEKLKKFKA